MGFRWKKSESLAGGLRRIAAEQIARALETLEDESVLLEIRVHELRKSCKKLRGLLRLVRPALDERVFREENACFRDLARQFAAPREAFVRLVTFDRLSTALARDTRSKASSQSLDPQRQELVAPSPPAATERPEERVSDADPRLANAVVALRAAASRIPHWKLQGDLVAALGAGLQRTQDRGRRAMKRARDEPTPEHIHKWRKFVKYGGYHMLLLSKLWPEEMRPRLEAHKELGEKLGSDHDLADLCAALATHAAGEHAEALAELMTHAQSERESLQRTAWNLGARLYDKKSKSLGRRLSEHLRS